MPSKLVYALLCSDVLVDRESGSASFIRAFEHGIVRKLPAVVPPCYVATLWESDPKMLEPFTLALTLISPSGEKQVLGKNEIQHTGAALQKVNFRLPGLNVTEQGRHTLVLAVKQGDTRSVAKELPLYVFLQPESGAQPGK
ncbi:MAG: hypothetical protein V3573_12130 [Desulfovibrionaceae bacterium]